MANIVLIGASSRIAKVLISYLQFNGHFVSTLSRKNIHLLDPYLMFSYFEKFDVLIHCAWPGVPPKKSSLVDFLSFHRNIFSPLISAAVVSGIPKIFILGTYYEYGHPSNLSLGFSCLDSLRPVTTYGFLKALSYLSLINDIDVPQTTQVHYLRLSNLYGSNTSSLETQLLNTVSVGHIFHLKYPCEIRDFMPTSMLSDRINYLIKLEFSPGFYLHHVGSGKPLTLAEFCAHRLKHLGYSLSQLDLSSTLKSPYPAAFFSSAQDTLFLSLDE